MSVLLPHIRKKGGTLNYAQSKTRLLPTEVDLLHNVVVVSGLLPSGNDYNFISFAHGYKGGVTDVFLNGVLD